MSRLRRRAAGVLLVVDGAGAALAFAALLPFLATHAATVVATVVARAAIGAVELVAGMFLLQEREPGARLGRIAAGLTAVGGTLAIGFRLAPSSVDPSMRLPTVAGYWLFAILVLALTRRGSPAKGSS